MTTPDAPVGGMVVETVTRVDPATADELWRLYLAAFAELRDTAASRHLLTRAEFDLEALDRRVTRYRARIGDRTVGLCTVTTDLTTVPWVAPEFYARRYPDHSARGAVFYCSLAMVHPSARRTAALNRMVAAFAADILAADGVLVADMCRHNVDVVELHGTVTRAVAGVWGGAVLTELDRQVFLAWEPAAAEPGAVTGRQP